MKKVDVIVLAGKSEKDTDLLEYLNTKEKLSIDSKGLIPIKGTKMISHIYEALRNSPSIDGIYLAGLKKKDFDFKDDVIYLDVSSQSSTVDKIEYWIDNYLNKKKKRNLALVMSADLPTVESEQIEWFIKKVSEKICDFHYGVVEEQKMEEKFPNSQRSFAKLKNGSFCGIDIFGFNPTTIGKYKDTFRRLAEKRKSFLKQAFFVAPFQFLKVLFRRASLNDVKKIAEKALNMSVNVLEVPFPELAMDVDKPHHYELVSGFMTKRRIRNE